MPATKLPVAAATDELLYPEYWLVSGLRWPGDGPNAAAAAAVAPGLIPRDALSHDAWQVLGCADLYVRKHCHRVIFFSDLTRMFADASTSWPRLGVDWERALRELHDGSFPAVFLTISERAYHRICSTVDGRSLLTQNGPGDANDNERELVRGAITCQLAADWPAYMQTIIDLGRVRLAR
jgi:hypothetical protein